MKIQPKPNRQSANGFTLVEILAAITILGIVLVVFMPFFTQYALFTSKSEENLDAINLAEQLMYKTKTNEELTQRLSNNPEFSSSHCDSPIKHSQYPELVPEYVESNKTYYPEIRICKDNNVENLFVVNISMYIKHENNKQFITEVYGYVSSEDGGED